MNLTQVSISPPIVGVITEECAECPFQVEMITCRLYRRRLHVDKSGKAPWCAVAGIPITLTEIDPRIFNLPSQEN